MPPEPTIKRTYAFIDGQNLFYAAKEAFDCNYPNYDPLALARAVCKKQDWNLEKTSFYTGIPHVNDNEDWNYFWTRKLASMGRRGINTYSRHLRYRNQTVSLSDGRATTILVGQEKGIDIRIALDVVRSALRKEYDVALIFSQDQDLSELAEEIREIANMQNRWIKIASAFPQSPTSRNTRGINRTDWIKIDRTTYDSCPDLNDYRIRRQ